MGSGNKLLLSMLLLGVLLVENGNAGPTVVVVNDTTMAADSQFITNVTNIFQWVSREMAWREEFSTIAASPLNGFCDDGVSYSNLHLDVEIYVWHKRVQPSLQPHSRRLPLPPSRHSCCWLCSTRNS